MEQRCSSPCDKDLDLTSSKNVGIEPQRRPLSPIPLEASKFEYERLFPAFFVQSHTNVAPQHRFSRDRDSLEFARSRIDQGFNSTSKGDLEDSATLFDPFTLLHLSLHRRASRQSRRQVSVKEIVENIHGTAQKPIDLTESASKGSIRKPVNLLECVATKYLKFAEDVRPPYVGTYTKICDQPARSKLCRNPFAKTLPTVDYDYDSEAEWEEPGEGEDLDSEGEEEAGEDEDDDEMEGFLDDGEGTEVAGAVNSKRHQANGDLAPLCTGLCWEGAPDQGALSLADGCLKIDLSSLRTNILSGRRNTLLGCATG